MIFYVYPCFGFLIYCKLPDTKLFDPVSYYLILLTSLIMHLLYFYFNILFCHRFSNFYYTFGLYLKYSYNNKFVHLIYYDNYRKLLISVSFFSMSIS